MIILLLVLLIPSLALSSNQCQWAIQNNTQAALALFNSPPQTEEVIGGSVDVRFDPQKAQIDYALASDFVEAPVEKTDSKQR